MPLPARAGSEALEEHAVELRSQPHNSTATGRRHDPHPPVRQDMIRVMEDKAPRGQQLERERLSIWKHFIGEPGVGRTESRGEERGGAGVDNGWRWECGERARGWCGRQPAPWPLTSSYALSCALPLSSAGSSTLFPAPPSPGGSRGAGDFRPVRVSEEPPGCWRKSL